MRLICDNGNLAQAKYSARVWALGYETISLEGNDKAQLKRDAFIKFAEHNDIDLATAKGLGSIRINLN